jgi:hypothetical protein
MTTPVIPAKRDFVQMVAKMGHPIMDIPDEKLRRLVAMTFITEFGEDTSVTYESIYNDIVGTMTTNIKDMQKQMAEAIAQRQTKTAADIYAALKPVIIDAFVKLPEGDRPMSARVLFDYRAAEKNPADGSPILDEKGEQKRSPDIELKLFWKESEARRGGSDGRVSSGSGRVAGSYLFPDSMENGAPKEWGSMAAYAKELHGYDKNNAEHKNPRYFLTEYKKLWTIPNQPTDGKYVATEYVAPEAA